MVKLLLVLYMPSVAVIKLFGERQGVVAEFLQLMKTK